MMTGDASQSAVLAAVMAAVVVLAWLVNGLLTPAVTRLAHRHKWYDILTHSLSLAQAAHRHLTAHRRAWQLSSPWRWRSGSGSPASPSWTG